MVKLFYRQTFDLDATMRLAADTGAGTSAAGEDAQTADEMAGGGEEFLG